MPRMDNTTLVPDMITFKRSRFFMGLAVLGLVVGVLIGILLGYVFWGRGQGAIANTAEVSPTQQEARRYYIPTQGYPSIGPKDAEITIVEFSDFQCPYCQKWHDQVYEQLMAAYPNKIRLVYRNLPLTQIHPQAMNAAEASLCANDQNVYWKYHDQLFDNSDTLGDELYSSIAADLRLNTATFEKCMSDHKHLSFIQEDMQFAIDLGVQSTPTFFINGLAVVGAQPLSVFQQVIDQELAGNIP
jgi:protein-disulfide isomerase